MNPRARISALIVLMVLIAEAEGANALPGRAWGIDQSQALTDRAGNRLLPEATQGSEDAAPTAIFPPYTITEISGPDFISEAALGISDSGSVVGSAYHPSGGYSHAFLWKNGVMTDLGTLGGKYSYGYGVNNKDQVVGESWTEGVPNTYRRAFIWQDNSIVELASFGSDSMAYKINDESEAVGDAYSFSFGQWRSFYSGKGRLTELGSLDGNETDVYSINERGQVVGFSLKNNGNDHAFLWQDGAMQDLMPEVNFSRAFDINNEGQVTGMAWMPLLSQFHAFLYQKNKPVIDLGTLGNDDYSEGKAVNDLGQVVGHSRIFNNTQDWRPFLWQDENRNGKTDPLEMIELNVLLPAGSGWVLKYVSDINNKGQIVGWGYLNGYQRGFLLSPVPTWTLMFYLDGDNDLGADTQAIFNSLELAKWSPHVNIVALYDNTANVDSAYYEVQHDSNPDGMANYVEGMNKWELGEVDMGNPVILSNFISWAVQKYPTDNYALVLSNHGTGLGGGLCDGACPPAAGARWMDLREMQHALADAYAITGKKMNVLSMNMCLMGMLEDAYQFRDYADYYVASENNLYGGFLDPYINFITRVHATNTPRNVAEFYASSYNLTLRNVQILPYTISAAEMTGLADVVTYANFLGYLIDSHMNTITNTVTSIAFDVQRFDNKNPIGTIDDSDTYIDLFDFARLAQERLSAYPDIVSASDQLMQAIGRYIIFEGHNSAPNINLDKSHGVSIFFPVTASSFYKASNYDFAVGGWGNSPTPNLPVQAGTWAEMLVHYFQATQPGGPDDPDPPLPLPWPIPKFDALLPFIWSRPQG